MNQTKLQDLIEQIVTNGRGYHIPYSEMVNSPLVQHILGFKRHNPFKDDVELALVCMELGNKPGDYRLPTLPEDMRPVALGGMDTNIFNRTSYVRPARGVQSAKTQLTRDLRDYFSKGPFEEIIREADRPVGLGGGIDGLYSKPARGGSCKPKR